MIKLKMEMWFYKQYAKMNEKRKSKEKTNKLFKSIDDLRRRCGYVK